MFFLLMDYGMNERIPKTELVEIWRYVGTFENVRELVGVACGEMIVEDNLFIFFTMGDLGARTLKHSLNLEKQPRRNKN